MTLLHGNYLTATEFAKAVKITRQGVNKAIKERRLIAVKIGNAWCIHEMEIKYFNRNKRHC